MSAKQSNLSNCKEQYDLVVALSQASINGTMQSYLYNGIQPVVTVYYNKDEKGNLVEVDRATLMTQTNNTDPLKINSWDGSKAPDQDITNLTNSDFSCAFTAQIGIPDDIDPIPDIIGLIPLNAGSVNFNLMCYMFTIVQVEWDGKNIKSYMNDSQNGKSLWMFTSNVPLKKVNDRTDLPAPVQQYVDTLKGDFSVQKLILDLDNARWESTPEIKGVDKGSPLYKALDKVFVGTYFNALKQKGKPVLHCSITPYMADPSGLNITGINLEVNPFVDPNDQPVPTPTKEQQRLITLNYLCAANNNPLAPPSTLTWNWLDNAADEGEFHGVIAINKKTLINYFQKQLDNFVAANCIKVNAYNISIFIWHIDITHQDFEVTLPATGSTVLTYSNYSKVEDISGQRGFWGHLNIYYSFDVSVEFTGRTIIIIQHMKVHLDTGTWWGPKFNLDIIDRTIKDTYTLLIDGFGKLSMQVKVENIYKDQWDKVYHSYYTDYILDLLQQLENNFVTTNLRHDPLSLIANSFFPGGKTFAFKDAFFSDNQDLVAHITYANVE